MKAYVGRWRLMRRMMRVNELEWRWIKINEGKWRKWRLMKANEGVRRKMKVNEGKWAFEEGKWKRKEESEGSGRSHVGNRSLQVVMGNERENGPRGHLLRPN